MAPPVAAVGLVYLTFFLDNVLLTVLVPIIPDWVRGEALALWAQQNAPLAAFLGGEEGEGRWQAAVGAVLAAKAVAQLLTAPLAAGAVARHGPAYVLRMATGLLAIAALGLAGASGGGAGAAWVAGVARALHGAGAALGGVSGLALAATALPAEARAKAIGALLGAVAAGVLVGYPCGGLAAALHDRAAPFLLLAGALLLTLALQWALLNDECYNRGGEEAYQGYVEWVRAVGREARHGAAGWAAGAVLLTTSVMAALEPCLPLWAERRFRPARWQLGAVFIPDSAAYLAAASGLGGAARRVGAERVALTGQVILAVGALCVPYAQVLWALCVPHAALGGGLGALDAALVPALLARRPPRAAPAVAALLQAAASAAYALGPVLGGALSWLAGFETALRTLAVLNLLYAALLYRALKRHPLSEQWGASETPDDSGDELLAH